MFRIIRKKIPVFIQNKLENNTRYYYHADALGSVVALSDTSGSLAETYAYSPFGKPDNTSTLGNPYLFTGRRIDAESGLYYYRARHYDPEDGRFVQPDPIGFEGGINLYAYASNNPINFIDPLGLESQGHAYEMSWMANAMSATNHSSGATGDGFSTGEIVATSKLLGGSVLAGLGLASLPESGPAGVALFTGGSATAADGFASLIAEGLGGDTGDVPALPIHLMIDIFEGITEDYDSPCGR